MDGKYVGLSLSRCVRDIIEGYVLVNQVEKIIARTAAPNEAIWDEVLYDYAADQWESDPERGIAVARQLIAEGKVEQPRLLNPGYKHNVDVKTGIWMQDGKLITHSVIHNRTV